MLNSRSSSRSPFTATQWQELEHQALIYKYMVSGVPIPPELLYSVKRSLESSLASRFFPHQSNSWGCFQVGFGRKADPEPGRCRRTDGKKWRCSKEAYPDSKYCEKHMHRGRNRSRKPVEQLGSTPANTNISNPSLISSPNNTTSPSTSSYSFIPLPSNALETDQNPGTLLNPFLPNHSSAPRPPGSSFSTQTSSTHNLFLDSSGTSSQPEKDYRYYHGIREGMDERAFFPEASGTVRRLQDPYQHLTMTSYEDYSRSQFQSFTDASKPPEEQSHCFVLGTDFKSQPSRPIKLEKDADAHKPMHHFFGDQWPPKNTTDSWLDLASTTRTVHSDG